MHNHTIIVPGSQFLGCSFIFVSIFRLHQSFYHYDHAPGLIQSHTTTGYIFSFLTVVFTQFLPALSILASQVPDYLITFAIKNHDKVIRIDRSVCTTRLHYFRVHLIVAKIQAGSLS